MTTSSPLLRRRQVPVGRVAVAAVVTVGVLFLLLAFVDAVVKAVEEAVRG